MDRTCDQADAEADKAESVSVHTTVLVCTVKKGLAGRDVRLVAGMARET